MIGGVTVHTGTSCSTRGADGGRLRWDLGRPGPWNTGKSRGWGRLPWSRWRIATISKPPSRCRWWSDAGSLAF